MVRYLLPVLSRRSLPDRAGRIHATGGRRATTTLPCEITANSTGLRQRRGVLSVTATLLKTALSRPGAELRRRLESLPRMGRRGLNPIVLATTYLFSFSAYAVTAPSLGEQHPDLADEILATMSSEGCLECHGDPSNAITPADSGYLPDRHHLRVDTPIGEISASPYPEKSSNGKHQCITCHLIDWVYDASMPLGGSYRFLQESGSGSRNCLACHRPPPYGAGIGSDSTTQAAVFVTDSYGNGGQVTPVISELSEISVSADPDSPLVILGSGFVDGDAGPESVESLWVRLTAYDGAVTDIHPDYASPTHLELTLPPQLPPGNYRLTVNRKGDTPGTVLSSQPVTLSVIPRIDIEDISCSARTVTVTGRGFSGHYLNLKNPAIGVRAGLNGEDCVVESWTDDQIVARCESGIGEKLEITTLYDSSEASITCGAEDQPKWWSIWSWWSSWSWARR